MNTSSDLHGLRIDAAMPLSKPLLQESERLSVRRQARLFAVLAAKKHAALFPAEKKRGISPLEVKHHHELLLILELVTDYELIAIDRGRN